MTVYVGLLRAVNVGGNAPVRMAPLRALLTRAGVDRVQSLLNTGNLVFQRPPAPTGDLERLLEAAVVRGRHPPIEFFVRTAAEWQGIIDRNPFSREGREDPGHLLVTLLKRDPSPEEWAALRKSIRGREKVEGSGREAYITYPDGVGHSRLTPAVLERALGTRSTSRNWNTVRKLGQLAAVGSGPEAADRPGHRGPPTGAGRRGPLSESTSVRRGRESTQ